MIDLAKIQDVAPEAELGKMQEALDLKAKEKANKKKAKKAGKGKKGKKGAGDEFMDDKSLITQDASVLQIQDSIMNYKNIWANNEKKESANFE